MASVPARVLAVVLALHALVLMTLAQLGTWRDRGAPPAERPPLQVWLLDALKARVPDGAAPDGAVPDGPAQVAAPVPAARTPETRRPPPRPGESQAITLPALVSTPAAAAGLAGAAATAPAAAAPAPAAGTPPPLNLALPRGASAPWRAINPAVDDSSARSARATFEGRFARELGGDGIWVEERLDTDRIRFRRGGTCVDMERGRGEQLDGFNQSFSPKPWLAKQPREC